MISYPRPLGMFSPASSVAAGQERWLMYFSLFLDESGKTKNSDFTAFCGYVSTMDEWARFQFAWDHLRFKHSIPTIHMSRIIFPERKDDEWKLLHDRITRSGVEWSDWYRPMLEDFGNLVANSNIVCVGGVVDSSAYRDIQQANPEDFLLANADSNVFLLQTVLMAALDKIEMVDKTGLMTVNIDDDEENAFAYYKSYWNLRRMIDHPKLPDAQRPRFARIPLRVDQIGFCNDGFHPAIQAADMIAYVSRAYKIHEVLGEQPENADLFEKLYAFLTRGGTHQPKMLHEEALKIIAGNTARAIRKAKDEENREGV